MDEVKNENNSRNSADEKEEKNKDERNLFYRLLVKEIPFKKFAKIFIIGNSFYIKIIEGS